jgi:hypothetical protein
MKLSASVDKHPLRLESLHHSAIRNQLFDSELCPVNGAGAQEDLWAAVEDIFMGE